ncbi:MAG TPA: AI-2E family transporter [Gemmatimonadales bacterium]|nr:AI-2E family transporter [Gemmatimonadales bacterium]
MSPPREGREGREGRERRESREGRAAPVAGVWTIAAGVVLAALWVARALLVPVALALVLALLLRPVMRGLVRRHVPAPLAAALLVLLLFGGLGGAVFTAAGPVRAWAERLPATLQAAQGKLRRLRRPFEEMNRAAQRVERAAAGEREGGRAPAPATPAAPAGPGVLARVFGTTAALVAGLVEVLLLLYFLLASGDLFLRRLVRALRQPHDKRIAVRVARDVEAMISRYLLATLLINLGQGACVALTMLLLGMPQPLVWGGLTVVLEFVPYLGGALMIILLAVVAVATFDAPGRILLAPGLYLLITTLQNNFVSPLVYGRRLALHPIAVFLGVLAWYLLWGIAGAFLAVPILAALKAWADRTERFAVVGEFLGE